ncbi:MAG TPA: hypothetical protein VI423_10855 [Paenisporosarcina sp.]|nr:hypothetical protein [Paenisporosarcina sp.]
MTKIVKGYLVKGTVRPEHPSLISMMYLSHFTVKDDLRPFKISQKQSEALVFYDCDFARAFMRQMNKHHKFWQWKVMKLVDTL